MSVTLMEVNEGGTIYYTATLKDQTGAVIPSSSLNYLTLTLFNDETDQKAIINSRNNQDILNLNGGTMNQSGVMTLVLGASDNVILVSGKTREVHRALIKYGWANGQDNHELMLVVINRAKV